MRRFANLLTIAAAAALFLAPTDGFAQGWSSVLVDGRAPVTGNGQIVTQQRPIGNFTQIESRGTSEIVVRVGPAPSLTITAESNILPLLRSDIKRGKLILDARHSYRTRKPVRIVITVSALDAMALNGSGSGRIEGVSGSRLALAIGGSGNISAFGRTASLAVAVDGSGNVDARGLAAANASVVVSGSGDVEVNAERSLSSVINGSGEVRYRGSASAVTTINNGSGRVRKVG
ncbi:head GIN domain-containing protein [Sphingomonas mesophila]|uniref:head GIN domain-containing protein n=1 Tax=Sphingomonas mesophila TaxID=2303576 RepID=UPI000E587BC8|nr:head GIN domain-containing protein [Sphingomonas mesophila]